MKKNFLVIGLLLLIGLSFTMSIDYDKKTNANVILFDFQKEFTVVSNSELTVHKILFGEELFIPQSYKIEKGPLRSVEILSNMLEIRTLMPVKPLVDGKNRLIFNGRGALNFEKLFLKEIKLGDLLNLFSQELKLNWIRMEPFPQEKLSLWSDEIFFEDFIRLIEKTYAVQVVFINQDTFVAGKNAAEFENKLPYFIKEGVAQKSIFDIQSTIAGTLTQIPTDTVYLKSTLSEILSSAIISSRGEKISVPASGTDADKDITCRTGDLIQYRDRILQEFLRQEVLDMPGHDFEKYELVSKEETSLQTDPAGKKEKPEELELYEKKLEKPSQNVTAEKKSVEEEKFFYFFNSRYDLGQLEKFFDCKFQRFDDYFLTYTSALNIAQIIRIQDFLNDAYRAKSREKDRQDEEIQKIHESYAASITYLQEQEKRLKESIQQAPDSKLSKDATAVDPQPTFSVEEPLLIESSNESTAQVYNDEILVEPQKSSQEIKEEDGKNITKRLNKVIKVPLKVKDIFDRIIIMQGINLTEISRTDTDILYLIEYDERFEEFVLEYIQAVMSEKSEVSESSDIKELIVSVCRRNGFNCVCDLSKEIKIHVNHAVFTMESLFRLCFAKGISYNYLDNQTIRFFNKQKMLKYEIIVMNGSDLGSITLENLYEIARLNITSSRYIDEKLNILARQSFYVMQGEEAQINSNVSIPVLVDEKDGKKVYSKVQSSFKSRVKGSYDEMTGSITTTFYVELTEAKEQKESALDSKTIETSFMTGNGGLIKIGGLNFSKTYRMKKGVPLLKNIPLIGDFFSYYKNEVSSFELVFLIRAEVLTKPVAQDYK